MGKDRVYLSEKKLHTRHVIRPLPMQQKSLFSSSKWITSIWNVKSFPRSFFILHHFAISFKSWKTISGLSWNCSRRLHTCTTFNCCRPKLTTVKTKLTDTNICSIVLKYILETGWTLHPGSMKVLSLITENVQPAGRRWSRVRDRHRPLFL